MHNICMLIVEDDTTCQRLSKHMLSALGYDPQIATSAEEALILLGGKHYDVIWMDINLPGISGLEATQIIRAHGHRTHIIATSASVFIRDQELAFAAGMNDYLIKPYSKQDLIAAIERYTNS